MDQNKNKGSEQDKEKNEDQSSDDSPVYHDINMEQEDKEKDIKEEQPEGTKKSS